MSNTQYIPLDAEAILSKFRVNDWPDENLFNQTIHQVLARAKGNGRRVRAFGEMVAILWAKGQVGATVRLEHLWNKFSKKESFSLFCAYPQSCFYAGCRGIRKAYLQRSYKDDRWYDDRPNRPFLQARPAKGGHLISMRGTC